MPCGLAAVCVAAHPRRCAHEACGLSLKELEVDPGTITEQVEIIPNALADVLRMQADGWISVEL